MAGSPDKWEFVKNGLNVVDVISILPFYIDLFFLQPPDVWVFLNQLKGKKWVPKHALKTKLVMIQRMAIIFSKKGVKRIPMLQQRLQTRHRVHCKQDFRFNAITSKYEEKVKIAKQVFRIFKLARVLKLARHSPGLQAIAYTLQVQCVLQAKFPKYPNRKIPKYQIFQ